MTVAQFPYLFSPSRIGSLELPNRIFQTAMGTNLANSDGSIGDDIVAFYAARAAGGAALLTMGAAGVSYPRGRVQPNQVAISDDRFLPGLKRIADAVHRNGGRLSAQLHHGGLTAVWDTFAGRPLLCPSVPLPSAPPGIFEALFPSEIKMPDIDGPIQGPSFEELDGAGIARLIVDFSAAADRAVEAGFDAIEVHAGHSYIVSSFLSPAENRRNDDYGGSPENRARLMKEIVEAIRHRVGTDFPVLCKINAAEFFVENGLTLDDVRTTAQIAESAGADAITVTATHNYSVTKALLSSYLPDEPGKLIPYATAVREAVSVPVVTVGRIESSVAEQAISEGKFDFLAMGRKQLADAEFTRHLAEGGPRAVRPCIYDYRCLSQSMLLQSVRCAANPDTGRENDDLLTPARSSRRAVVVGGGPSGMEAARRLSLRGHTVTLLEAGAQLGGAALLATKVHPPNGLLVDWLCDQLTDHDIDVRLNTHATVETIEALDPDVVLLAAGARYTTPAIEGHDLPHVVDGASLKPLLLEDKSFDAEHVVILGNDLIALQLARYLHADHTVTVVDGAAQFGWGIAPARRAVVLAEIAESDITLRPNATVLRIEPDAVVVGDHRGVAVGVRADAVIIVNSLESNRSFYDEVCASGIDAHLAGDSVELGYIYGALSTAADVCAQI